MSVLVALHHGCERVRPSRPFPVLRHDGAAVAESTKVLGRVEAERRRHAEAADAPAFVARAVCLAGVLDDREAVAPGQRERGSMSAGCPNRWTGTIVRVRGDTAAPAATGSIPAVVGRQSTKTGRAPTRLTASAVAKKVLTGTMTSSPGPTPTHARASLRASVPLLTPTQWRVSQKSANSCSNCRSSGPSV